MFPSVDHRLAIVAVLPASLVVIKALMRLIQNRQHKPCLPPGPVPLPLLGNVLSIDTKEPWLTYTEWGATYGDLVFMRLLGQEIVVVNSQHVAETLIDKRSRIYSDRPYIATLKPFGWSVVFAFLGYDDEWRLCRRLFHQTFRPDSALKFRPLQIRNAREMIVNLTDDPEHYHSHFATFSSSVAMSVTYGYQTVPRSYETTTAALMNFTLAMVLYPDVQKRAQAEIDFVVGGDRLPTFEDRASLPYVESVLRETLRWHPVGPLGVPHATSSDDTYDGYFIPKGTTVISNIWAISRDEKRYPKASSFIPERFLDVNNALTDDDPASYVFGFGRRACPGRHAADASLWSAIVTILATVKFSPAKDDQGKAIEFTPQFTTGLTRSPVVFPCNISARSRAHLELVDAFRTRV
ncbi:cytochrome P450 [Suillus decipiens]|nr:cytochrome P450 [Suillus decipiens]